MVAQLSKLSEHQQLLIAQLQKLPQEWALTPVYGDKTPYRKNWQGEKPITKVLIERDIRNGKAKGYGLRTGKVSGGIVAVDADGHAPHEKILELSGGVVLPETVAFTSNKPGRCQYLFYVPQEYWEAIATKKISTAVKGEDGKIQQLELRWDGCQSVLPPSVHPETNFYRWRKSPEEVAIAQAPMWLIEQMLDEPASEVQRLDDIQLPVDGVVPLTVCLTRRSRDMLSTGAAAPDKGRNDSGIELARDLIGTADYLDSLGQRFEGNPETLFFDWCCTCGLDSDKPKGQPDKIWKSANKGNSAPGSGRKGVDACIRGWDWRENRKTTGRSFSGGIGSGGGRRGNGSGSGGSGGGGGDDGDGDGGNRIGKVVKHPSFSPISPYELEARLNALIQEGLTGSKLTNKLNQLALETGRHIIELRKQYSERLAEVEQAELREDTAHQVEVLLEASTASLDLRKILPANLATPLLKLAGWLNLKPEAYLTTLLTTVSILHKAGTIVVLNKEWDFEVSPNMFGTIISPSSQKKSPILKAICKKPLGILQREAHEEYKNQMKAYGEELKEWEATKPEDREEPPVKPERKIYFFTKTTGEGLTYQAARCPEQGILCLSDELAGMLGAQNQYRGGKGSDKQDWLTYYDGMGDTTLRAEGVKAESDFVLLGIIGGIQPKIMQKLLDDCSDSDGGWARFLFVNQPNAASEMSVDGGSYDLTDLLADLYRQIDALPATTYRLSPEAFRLFCKAYNSLERKRVSDRLEGMQAVWGKSEGRIGKLAVNLHVIHALMNGETPSEEIPAEFIQAAIILTKYYAQQVQSLYTKFSDPDALAPHLANVIQLAQRKGDWIKASDVYLSITKKHRPSGEKVREWFGELVLMGKGEVKGEGRSLHFRVFSDKHPPKPPSSDPPPVSNFPSGKLDDFRQELDRPSNAESTIYQDLQEELDKLDELDDFPKTENQSTEVDEEELDDNQDEVESPRGKNQVLDELSILSNNSQEDRLVGDVALDDLSKESSNLDNLQEIVAIASAPTSPIENAPEATEAVENEQTPPVVNPGESEASNSTVQLEEELTPVEQTAPTWADEVLNVDEVADPESTFDEVVEALVSVLRDEAICPNKEELAVLRHLYSADVLNAACKLLSPERHRKIKQWVLELNQARVDALAADVTAHDQTPQTVTPSLKPAAPKENPIRIGSRVKYTYQHSKRCGMLGRVRKIEDGTATVWLDYHKLITAEQRELKARLGDLELVE
jgi:uncharacterized membrane protein YgcG